MTHRRRIIHRRGTAYIVVLSIALIVMVIGMSAMTIARTQRGEAYIGSDSDEARMCAYAGVELARLWVNSDPNWRTNRINGVWADARPFGNGSFRIEGTDPHDADLADSESDTLLIRSTGTKGRARHIAEVMFEPIGPPLDALQHALHTAGQLHIRSGKHLKIRNATTWTSGALRNEGAITTSMHANTVTAAGTINGTLTTGASSLPLPANDLAETYAAFGTLITPGNTIEKLVLSPGLNPWGKKNPYGIYVIRTSSDLTIRRCRINGTLIVINPGRKVSIESEVFIHPHRTYLPTLIVTGNIEMKYSSAAPLSEAVHSTNFNPAGAAFKNNTDNDTADVYPSEIQGLVHVKGNVKFDGPGLLRGILLSESKASSDAIDCNDVFEIVYDQSLYSSPPLGYTKKGKMAIIPGTWARRVD